MPASAADLTAFASEVRRLRHGTEAALYPAYRALLRAVYGPPYHVDQLLAAPTTGFPDFTVSLGARLLNWVEVKKPDVSVPALPAPDAARFNRYRVSLPLVVLTNGNTWILYVAGIERDRVDVPAAWLETGRRLSAGEEALLLTFVNSLAAFAPSDAVTYDEAVRLLAAAARVLFDVILELCVTGLPNQLSLARASFAELLRTNPSDPENLTNDEFADALAQACTFGYLIARMGAGGDIEPTSAHNYLDTTAHPFLKTTLHALVAPDPQLEAALGRVLRTVADAVNASAPQIAGPGGAWTDLAYVYEPFFAEYRPEDRFKYGVFYTPREIAAFQVSEVARQLRDFFGLQGLSDPAARFLDPACGTGTYLLALAEAVEQEAIHANALVPQTLLEFFENRLFAFEVSPGPASVAQARLTAWLRARGVQLRVRFPVYTVNTLTPPASGSATMPANFWAQNVSLEQQAGDHVKRDVPILVVIGNPPWGTRTRATFQIGPNQGDNWIADWARGAQGAVIQLYDLYVAFWRFGLQTLLERPQLQQPEVPGRGIVSFITNRTWIRGKAFRQMREWMRARGVTVDTVDLGGDSRSNLFALDDAVFDIQAGTAISTVAVGAANPPDHAEYRRVFGTRAQKLFALANHALPARQNVAGIGTEPFAPVDWGLWQTASPIARFFVNHFPGVKTHRDHLVVAVDESTLLQQLQEWTVTASTDRDSTFHPTRDRQPPSRAYEIDPRFVVPHRYRPLDDRALYGDRRFVDQPGGIFNYYVGGHKCVSLLCMDTRTGQGPVVIACNTLPGYNSFRGSYETHAFPLEPEPEAGLGLGQAQVLTAPAAAWARGLNASPTDVGAYILALGTAPLYGATFGSALEADIIRFPATTDAELFDDAVRCGRELLEAWTLAVPPLGKWVQAQPGAFLGSAAMVGDNLEFANGARLLGINPDTFQFAVSNYPVVQRFLEARAEAELTVTLAREIQRVAAAVDRILRLQPACDTLFQRALATQFVGL